MLLRRPGASWRYQGLGSLAQVRLGTINSYSYGQEIDAYVRMHRAKGDRVQVVSGEQALEMNVEKVRFGRLDATVENSWVMENLLARTRQQDRLQAAGCRAPDVPIYLAFSPPSRPAHAQRPVRGGAAALSGFAGWMR